jgi:hypothetical protein
LTEADTVRLVIPTVRGALVLKGAAYLEDSRDRGRHAEDAVVLLACMDDAREALIGLSQRSRRRVRTLVNVLTEQTVPWANHDDVVQALGRETLAELSELLGKQSVVKLHGIVVTSSNEIVTSGSSLLSLWRRYGPGWQAALSCRSVVEWESRQHR